MSNFTVLPDSIVEKYNIWKDETLPSKSSKYEALAQNGQYPSAIVIACCDSRINTSTIFDADPGDFFVHRNIANLVPAYDENSDNTATASAIEYAVTALGVKHIVIMGHTQCGGVKGCHDMCSGKAPQLADSFVGKWIESIRPAYEKVTAMGGDETAQVENLEKESILNSLSNLMDFPFVAERVKDGTLSLHGTIFNISNGEMEQFNPENNAFEAV